LEAGSRKVIVGALYHPPKPMYQPDKLIDYIERCFDALTFYSPTAMIIVAGDFNTLNSDDIVSRTSMLSIVNQPTRSPNCLDKIFVNESSYDGVKVVNSAVKSDHKAIVAYTGFQPNSLNKHTMKRKYRLRTPAQHAAFLNHITNVQFEIGSESEIQANFDKFYEEMYILLDQFYPERNFCNFGRPSLCHTGYQVDVKTKESADEIWKVR